MANVLNEDFIDFLESLNKNQVEYLLVGGYAVIFHGYNRTTGDLDVWIKPTPGNYLQLKKAFLDFGMSLFDMTEEKFVDTENYDVFVFGNPPVSIDILTKVKGLEFDEAFAGSALLPWCDIMVRMIDIRDLKSAKRASGRSKDLDDLENLER